MIWGEIFEISVRKVADLEAILAWWIFGWRGLRLVKMSIFVKKESRNFLVGKNIFPNLKVYGYLPDSAVLSFSAFFAVNRHTSQYPSLYCAPSLSRIYTSLNNYIYFNIYKRIYKGVRRALKNWDTEILGQYPQKSHQ